MTGKTEERAAALEVIRSNIRRSGYHVYIVSQGVVPRFAYTIGLSELFGAELVVAGAIHYMAEEVLSIISKVVEVLKKNAAERKISVQDLGVFSLRTVDDSWKGKLLLGALDYYQVPSVPALQVVPDAEHWTNDVPNLSQPISTEAEPVWKWLQLDWHYPVPANSSAVTNLAALRGEPIREVARWEEDQWEMFTEPPSGLSESEIRIAPLSTLLALDRKLVAATELAVGEGILRDGVDGQWREWRD